jgi:hypothetical protein
MMLFKGLRVQSENVGICFASKSCDRDPGLKIETWATHPPAPTPVLSKLLGTEVRIGQQDGWLLSR